MIIVYEIARLHNLFENKNVNISRQEFQQLTPVKTVRL